MYDVLSVLRSRSQSAHRSPHYGVIAFSASDEFRNSAREKYAKPVATKISSAFVFFVRMDRAGG